MLYSQGVPLEAMGIPDRHGEPKKTDDRAIWRLFAENWYLFRATPSRLWFEHSLESVFGINERLTPLNADRIYDQIADALQKPELRPRALYDAFRIEAISTTDAATDDLRYHDQVLASGWHGRVLPAYRPDFVIDPEREGFAQRVPEFVALTGMPLTWAGYLDAHRSRRAYFKARGATSSDHGHPSARTANLSRTDAAASLNAITAGRKIAFSVP